MAYFIHVKSDVLVLCYGGTHCSNKRTAEITEPHLIDKARRNAAFIEVDEPAMQTRVSKKAVDEVSKKKAPRKRAKKAK